MEAPLWPAPGFCPGLTCYPYIPAGVHYIVSKSGQRSSRRPIYKAGSSKEPKGVLGSVYAPKVSCAGQKGGLFILHPLAADNHWALRQVRPAARRIGLCGSATRAPGRPWIADASRAWPGTSCARPFLPRMTLQTMAKAKNSSSLHSDLFLLRSSCGKTWSLTAGGAP